MPRPERRWRGRRSRETEGRGKWVSSLSKLKQYKTSPPSREELAEEVKTFLEFRFPSAQITGDDVAAVLALLAEVILRVGAEADDIWGRVGVYLLRATKVSASSPCIVSLLI